MKKRYEKPEIIFEDFSMNTAIAANCDEKLNTPTNGTCGYMPEGYDVFIFTSDISGCTEKHDNGFGFDVNDALCYHVPSGNNNLFNS